MKCDSYTNRDEYLKTINKFVEGKRVKASKKRNSFFTTDKVQLNHEEYRQKFAKMIGISADFTRVKTKLVKVEYLGKKDNSEVYRYIFKNSSGIKHFGLFFKVADVSKAPFVIGLHGGSTTVETVSGIDDSENYNHFVERIIAKGINVFCPQLLLWNKEVTLPKDYNRAEIDARLKQCGTSISALEMSCITGIINYFIEIEKMNPERIGIAGLSYGGMYAMFLGAYDLRYKAVLSSCFFNDRYQYSWTDWSYQNAQHMFTDVEIASLICPRLLFISLGDHDAMFDYKYAKPLLIEVDNFYKSCHSSSFKYEIFDGDHEFNKNNDMLEDFVKSI